MTTKQKVMKAVVGIPNEASLRRRWNVYYFLAKVEKGIQQAHAGQTIPHEQVKQKTPKWLKLR
jgi:predicted transcriptional regulator